MTGPDDEISVPDPPRPGPAKVVSLVDRLPARTAEPPWSPVELLEALLDDIRAGRAKPECLMVFYMHDRGDGTSEPVTWAANCTAAEVEFYRTGEWLGDRQVYRQVGVPRPARLRIGTSPARGDDLDSEWHWLQLQMFLENPSLYFFDGRDPSS